MGGKFSTIPDNKSQYVTPAYNKPTNQHWSNNYVPETRAPTAPAFGPFPAGNYNPPSANIVPPPFVAAKPSTGNGVGGSVGGLPMNATPPSAKILPPPFVATKTSTGNGVGGGIGGLPVNAANPKEVLVFHSSTKWREYFEASKQSNKLVVIYFTATWCGPCKYMEPTIKELAAKHTNIDIVKIDVDELFNVSREYGIQAMPTFLFMKNGKEIDKVVGAKKEDLQNKVEKHSRA